MALPLLRTFLPSPASGPGEVGGRPCQHVCGPVPSTPCTLCPPVFFPCAVLPFSPGPLAWAGPFLPARPPPLWPRAPVPLLSPHHRPWPSWRPEAHGPELRPQPASGSPPELRGPLTPSRSFCTELHFGKCFSHSPYLPQTPPALPPAQPCRPERLQGCAAHWPERGAGWEGLRGCWVFHSINW